MAAGYWRNVLIVFLFAVFAGVMFFAPHAKATDYYWGHEYYPGWRYPTPAAFCDALFNKNCGDGSCTNPNTTHWLSKVSDDRFECHIIWGTVVNPRTSVLSVKRYGDSCPEGTTYNSETGACDALPPECPEGDLFPARGPDSPVINSGGRNYVATGEPPTACYNQCRYVSDDGRAASCYLVPGSTTTGFCNYVLTSNGENCSAEDYRLSESGDPLNPSGTPDVPPSDPDDPGCPSGWAWSGTTCVKTDGGDNGGDTGGDNGGDGGSPGDGGGSGGSGGDGGSSGDGGGSGGSGGDGGSPGDGGGSGGSGGGGDGDDEGQCDPATDPNKCGQSSVAGEACNAELICEGDAIQCAILRQAKEHNCMWALGETEQAQVTAAVSGEGFELEEKSFSASGLFSDALNEGRWLGSSCPPPRTLSVMGRTITFSWQPVCDFATALAPIIVAMASLFFALFVFRGIKGS